MTTERLPNCLTGLVDYLDNLTERCSVPQLREHLDKLDVSVEDVSKWVRFGQETYLRNLVCDGAFYHLLVLCWRSGQRSPIHNHAHSTCGVRILSGTATETTFATTPSSLVKAVDSKDWKRGDVSVSQDSFIHQLSNLQAKGDDLVTLHVYSPPLLRMDTFSLTDARVGEWRPMILEHALGSGI
jgi:cysteine dioxygenase